MESKTIENSKSQAPNSKWRLDERFFLFSRENAKKIRAILVGDDHGRSYSPCGSKDSKAGAQHELLIASESGKAFHLPVATTGVVSFSQIARLCHDLRGGISDAVNGIVHPFCSVNMNSSVDGRSPERHVSMVSHVACHFLFCPRKFSHHNIVFCRHPAIKLYCRCRRKEEKKQKCC
jgi:hypothetical protein